MKKAFLAILCIVALLCVAAYAAEPVQINSDGDWSAAYPVASKEFGQILYMEIPPEQPTREIVIKMEPVGSMPQFDPDIYVRFDEPPTRTKYDASDISKSDEHVVTMTASAAFPMPSRRKVFIGVYAYSAVGGSFRVRAFANGCVANNCGGQTRGLCVPDSGQCNCNKGFQTIPNCRAEDRAITLQTTVTGSLSHNQIAYYNVTLPARATKSWFVANLVRTSGEQNGSAVMYMRKGALPTSQTALASQWIYNGHVSAALTLNDNQYSEGQWTIAVVNNSKATFAYTIGTKVQRCKNGCSGHGTCNEEKSVCTCDPQYTLNDDCSIRSSSLVIGETQWINPEPWGSTFFSINVSKPIADAPLELGVHLQLKTEDKEIPANFSWPTMFATLGDSKPSMTNFDFTSRQPSSHNQTIYIPDSHLAPGNINLLVYNQNAKDYQYEIKLVTRPHCPLGCFKNGICTQLAECNCAASHIGGSCDISQADCNKIRGITTGTSWKAAIAIFFIAGVLAAGVAAFIYAKFFYVAPQASQPELQYDPLAA